MDLRQVSNKRTKKDFLDTARIIYKDDPYWVCPLDVDVNSVFDPKKNVFFEHGDACRWVLYNAHNKPIGRVAAFINEKKAYNFEQPTGGMGFFECINDQQAGFSLFDQCKQWLSERGMEAMDGPINFGENDRFWGLLVEGFMHPGYGMPYNHPYYQALFESYGLKFYFEQVSNHLNLDGPNPLPERFAKIAEWVTKKPGYRFEHLKMDQVEKYIKDFLYIYNLGWAFHENFTPMNPEDLRRSLKKLKPILEEKFIWFAYVNDQPVGFMIMIPDVNQILKHLNGKTNLWAKLKFLYHKWKGTIDRTRIPIMGVIPKYQKAGIEAGLMISALNVTIPMQHYKEVELSWVGDFNPKMRALHESAGSKLAKKHYTYRKLFKDKQQTKRSVIIPVDTKKSV